MTRPEKRLDTQAMIRDGRSDPMALLLLWCVKKLFFPLLWIGLTVAVLATQDAESRRVSQIDRQVET